MSAPPHIVSILDFNVENDTPFLVMDYAPNGTLRQRHRKGTTLPCGTVLGYLWQVADALQYAHNERLIHRDIKPENMLVGWRDDILLSDFGIAVVVQGSGAQMTQDVIGTLTYMAPEQLYGKPRPASDQYALAIVAYEWLCGDVPFHGSVAEVSAQHMNAAPPSLCEQKPTIPFAIEEVVLKALAKNPEQRYSSLLDFVKAFEDACPREPLILRESNAGPNINVRTPNSHLADTVLAVTSHSTSSPSPTSSPTSIPLGTTLHTYRGHTDVVTAVAWSSPDGAYIASASADKTVQVWDSGTGGVNASSYSGHSAAVNAVAWSPDETRIASSSADKTVQVWNASDGGNPYTYHGHSNVVYSVAWSPDGTTIASSSADKTVQIWQAT